MLAVGLFTRVGVQSFDHLFARSSVAHEAMHGDDMIVGMPSPLPPKIRLMLQLDCWHNSGKWGEQ